MQEKKKIKTIQQGWVEFTLTEYPGRAELPGPHYSLTGQSAREMALGIGQLTLKDFPFSRFSIFT